MELTIEVLDQSKFNFFLELISNFSFLKIKKEKSMKDLLEKDEDQILLQLMEKSKNEEVLLSKDALFKEMNW